ncbi:ATP-binding protein [Streptomyces sp. NPDC008222]|uniref:PAS domain-containing sensor histidine kinase n=1 Tax=Streptomyces sp. NPDC008222 TaxID=3364820 RepID=UPI0036ED1846
MTDIGTVIPSILDAVPQPVLVGDRNGTILYANLSAVDVLGYDEPEDLLGLNSHATLHHSRPDGSPIPSSECALLSPAVTGENAHSDDDWFIRRDGSFFPSSWWSAPIDLPTGRGVVHAFTDVTERRAFERAERERGAAEIRANESRAAQRRIMDSIAAVRQQTARDLHDGAQQRLVSLLIGLRLAREQLPGESSGTLALLDHSIKEAQAAIDELRELAAGIHPSVLTSRGLLAAVGSLAARSPIPTMVSGSLDQRLPAPLESNAYFMIAEALTNAVKHSGASRIDITVSAGASLDITVRDNGRGGVGNTTAGSGLVGLRDRAAAFDGTLTIDSSVGSGTVVHARIPSWSASAGS